MWERGAKYVCIYTATEYPKKKKQNVRTISIKDEQEISRSIEGALRTTPAEVVLVGSFVSLLIPTIGGFTSMPPTVSLLSLLLLLTSGLSDEEGLLLLVVVPEPTTDGPP